MNEWDFLVRFAAFIAVFIAMAAWELVAPRRRPLFPRIRRWPHNLGLLVVDVLTLRILAPGAAIGVALVAQEGGWGFLNAVSLPWWLAVIAGVVLLDLAIYFQHVMFHAVPTLWRMHRVHHADMDFDVTTGVRFHPFEIAISTAIKCAAVAAIGAPAAAVLVFEVLLNGTAIFNHANVSIPPVIERWLRCLVVTPDMHRVHHSAMYDESSSNFGFNLPWWDRIFGTYKKKPWFGHDGITFGVDAFRTARDLRLDQLLIQPFQNTPGRYPINRRQATEQ